MKQANLNQVIQVLRRFSLDHWGANEQVAWQTARLLKQRGTPSSILSTSALAHSGNDIYKQVPINRVNYFYPDLGTNDAKRKQLDLKGGNPYSLGLLKALFRSPSKLIHCHTHSRLAAEVRVIARFKNIPYVISLQGGAYQLPKSEQSNLDRLSGGWGRYGYVLDQFFKPQLVLRDASGLICSSYDEFIAARKQFPLKPSLYLPGGVDQARFTALSKVDIRAKYKIGKEKFLLLCSGRIDSQKNQLLLLELMNDLSRHHANQFHLVLMGHRSNKHYFDCLVQRIKSLKLDALVTLICDLNGDCEELAAAYQQADALVIPSIYEPIGLPVLEGWVSRLPVLAAKTGALSHLIDDGHNGVLFNPYCKRSLGEAVHTLISHPELGKKMVAKGYEKVTQQFLWSHYIEKLMAFYEEIEIAHASQTASHLTC